MKNILPLLLIIVLLILTGCKIQLQNKLFIINSNDKRNNIYLYDLERNEEREIFDLTKLKGKPELFCYKNCNYFDKSIFIETRDIYNNRKYIYEISYSKDKIMHNIIFENCENGKKVTNNIQLGKTANRYLELQKTGYEILKNDKIGLSSDIFKKYYTHGEILFTNRRSIYYYDGAHTKEIANLDMFNKFRKNRFYSLRHVDVSPDKGKIIFSVRHKISKFNSEFTIYELDIKTCMMKLLCRGFSQEYSPNGKYILFSYKGWINIYDREKGKTYKITKGNRAFWVK